jgi:4-hydroxy-3-polyprenylbenzoate decarboxylase
MRYLVGISGASGSIYGIKLLQELKKARQHTELIISDGAKNILQTETSYTLKKVEASADVTYDNNNLCAGPASGSYPLDGMIIAPCSMKTLSAIANGYSDTLITRAASCCLKEHRPLILVPRETPLDLPGIRNMLVAKESGAVILPAMPGFYHKPKIIDDQIDFIIGKILDQLKIKHTLFKRWK